MKSYPMLGVNSKSNDFCKLLSLIPFDNLTSSNIEAEDFLHDSSSWCGLDRIKTTLKIMKMKQTGKKIVLDKPIVFHGSDYNWGRETRWSFEVNEIHELEWIKK